MKQVIFAVIILSVLTSLKAQPIDLGFRLESQVLFTKIAHNESDSETSSLLTCGELTFGIYPIKKLLIEARFGYEPGIYFLGYKGTEYGIYAKYFLFNSLYFTGGIADHTNDGDGGYGSSKNLVMPSLGIGVKPWKHVGIELLYQKANRQAISGVFDRSFPENSYTIYLSSLLKISIAADWIIGDF